MKKRGSIIFITVMLLWIEVFSKGDPPTPKPLGPPINPGTPIDGNISILLIAGVLLGVYSIYKNRTLYKLKKPL